MKHWPPSYKEVADGKIVDVKLESRQSHQCHDNYYVISTNVSEVVTCQVAKYLNMIMKMTQIIFIIIIICK